MKKIYYWIAENWIFLIFLVILAFMIMICGCSSTKTIPTAHDTVYINNTQYQDRYVHDSIWQHDSVYFTIAGDTVWMEKWHTKYIEHIKYDSVEVHDTNYVSKEVPVEVEKIKYKTPALMWGICIALVLVTIIACLMSAKILDDKK